MKQTKMSYVIACWKKGVPHGIQIDKDGKPKFKLIPLTSTSNVSKIFNNPHRTQMEVLVDWIKSNDTDEYKDLKRENFTIEDYGRFRR